MVWSGDGLQADDRAASNKRRGLRPLMNHRYMPDNT